MFDAITSGYVLKGTQAKFIRGEFCYKVDRMGYESIAEAIISELERFIVDFDFIDYTLETVLFEGHNESAPVSPRIFLIYISVRRLYIGCYPL